MNPVLFDFDRQHAVTFRDSAVRRELAEDRIRFVVVHNDDSAENYRILTGLKNLFQKQLPKMPKEYIARLVYDRKHTGLAIVRPSTRAVIGGITYRLFPEQTFCEIVFCAVSSSEQVKGFGGALMNELKDTVFEQTQGQVRHYLTYADNYAIGYFKKQGFSKEVSLDRALWAGYIKDYDGGTLMQCTVVDGVLYRKVYSMLHGQKMRLVRAIDKVTGCAAVYPGLTSFDEHQKSLSKEERKSPLEMIPGLAEAGWTEAMSRDNSDQMRRGHLYGMLRPLLSELQAHHAAWPFLKAVDVQEVPSYYQIITSPMDLGTMDVKLESDSYHNLPEFIADFNLIIANCRRFNEPDTSYCKNATNLERFFQERLAMRHARMT